MLAPNRKRRGSNLKRDIFAVITFVATGFLFYLIQTQNPREPGSQEVPGIVEKVSVQDPIVETPVGIAIKDGGSRDS